MDRQVSLKELGFEFARTRSEESFRALYERVRPGLENHLFKMTRDRGEAGHLLSETMMAVREKIEQYNPKWHISTWIYRIAYINFCAGIRAEKRKKVSLIADAPDGPSASHYQQVEFAHVMEMDRQSEEEPDARKEAMLDALPSLVDRLPSEMRELVRAKFYDGLTLRQIADATNTPIGELSKRLTAAKGIMRRSLNGKGEVV